MILVRSNKGYGCGKNKVLREHGTGETQTGRVGQGQLLKAKESEKGKGQDK